jgi:hypothetical protein
MSEHMKTTRSAPSRLKDEQGIAKPRMPRGHTVVRGLTPIVLSLLCLAGLLPIGQALAGVSVFDQVTTPNKPFYLKLRTHRGPLTMGGVRGAFWIDAQMVGDVLTGTDGYGFLKYSATVAGEFTISARTDAGQAEGRLMVIAPSTPAVLFEVEAFAWRTLVRPRDTVAQRVMQQIAENFKIVYLCGLIGKTAARELIRTQNFPPSVVLVGKDRDQFAQLQHRGVQLYAVVGSPAMLSAAEDHCPRRFSFEAQADARLVKDWEDLWDQLNQQAEVP